MARTRMLIGPSALTFSRFFSYLPCIPSHPTRPLSCLQTLCYRTDRFHSVEVCGVPRRHLTLGGVAIARVNRRATADSPLSKEVAYERSGQA